MSLNPKPFRSILAAALIAAVAQPALAAGDLHFACTSASTATQGFGAVRVRDAGPKLSVCADAGCWEGPVTGRRMANGVDLIFATVRKGWMDNGTPTFVAVAYDRRTNSAQMTLGGGANRAGCLSHD